PGFEAGDAELPLGHLQPGVAAAHLALLEQHGFSEFGEDAVSCLRWTRELRACAANALLLYGRKPPPRRASWPTARPCWCLIIWVAFLHPETSLSFCRL